MRLFSLKFFFPPKFKNEYRSCVINLNLPVVFFYYNNGGEMVTHTGALHRVNFWKEETGILSEVRRNCLHFD